MDFRELGKGKYWVSFDSVELPAIVRLVKTLEESRHAEEQRALEKAIKTLEEPRDDEGVAQ